MYREHARSDNHAERFSWVLAPSHAVSLPGDTALAAPAGGNSELRAAVKDALHGS